MPGSWPALPSLFGLAPCGVYPASGFTDGAVRSYRTISPLPRRRRSKLLQGRPPPERKGVAEAVSFLWHWPSADLKVRVPDVIRHTALRSSDFPPPAAQSPKPPAATARSSCQGLVYREGASTTCAWDDCARTSRWHSTSLLSLLPAWDRSCAPDVPVPAAFSGS